MWTDGQPLFRMHCTCTRYAQYKKFSIIIYRFKNETAKRHED